MQVLWESKKVLVHLVSSHAVQCFTEKKLHLCVVAGSLEAAYSLNWGAREIWGKGGGETLALL